MKHRLIGALTAAVVIVSSAAQATPVTIGNAIGFMLNHGIQEKGKGQEKLQQFLQNQYCPSALKSCVDNSSYSWQEKSLPNQALEVTSSMNALKARVDTAPIVLIGHSQGGLRLRQWAQFTSQGSPVRQQVAGLITIGTPHRGAPVTRNGPATVAYATLTIGAGIGAYFGPLGVVIGGGVGTLAGTVNGFLDAFKTGLVAWFGGAATPDMTPGSQFFADLNNTPRQVCSTQQYQVRVYVLWWSWLETRTRTVCNSVTPTSTLPNNIPGLALVGQNPDFDSYFAQNLNLDGQGFRGLRTFYAVQHGILAAAAWAAAFPTFGATIPQAIAWTNFAYFWADLPGIWARTIGEYQSDAFMPENSQRMDFATEPKITTGIAYTANLYSSHHSGWCGEVFASDVSAITSANIASRGPTPCTGQKPIGYDGSPSTVRFESGANAAVYLFVKNQVRIFP